MRTDTGSQIYEKTFVTNLFSEMSKTYGVVNYLSSFGFTERWRRQCAQQLQVTDGAVVYDLMTGMGEMFPHILARSKPRKILGVDFCPEMCRLAESKTKQFGEVAKIDQMDVLSGKLESDAYFHGRPAGERMMNEMIRVTKSGGEVRVSIAIGARTTETREFLLRHPRVESVSVRVSPLAFADPFKAYIIKIR